MKSLLIETPPASSVAEGSHVQGSLVFYSYSQVFGAVEGELVQQSLEPLQIGKTGWVKGNISALGPVVIEGRVFGTVHSSTSIRVSRTARVEGKLTAPCIEIEPGAYVESDFAMNWNTKSEEIPLSRAA